MRPMAGADEISGQDLERWLAEVCHDGAAQALLRIADQCLLSEALLHRLVMAPKAGGSPFESLVQKLLADDSDAWIKGALGQHETRALLKVAGQTLQADGFRLHYALRRITDVYALTSATIVEQINRNGVFGQDTALLLQGIGAWLEEDHVKAFHVLVPQIERAVRQLMGTVGAEKAGGSGTTAATDRSTVLGDALYRDGVGQLLGRDLRLHLLTLFAEPPGWDLRNQFVRGLMPAEAIHEGITNWLLHLLLVIGGLEPRAAPGA